MMSAVAPNKAPSPGSSIEHIALQEGIWLRSGGRSRKLTMRVSMMSFNIPPFLATQNTPSSPRRQLAGDHRTMPASDSLQRQPALRPVRAEEHRVAVRTLQTQLPLQLRSLVLRT